MKARILSYVWREDGNELAYVHIPQPQIATQFSFDEMYKPLQHRETVCFLVRLVQVSSGYILDIFLNLRLRFFRDVIVDVGPRSSYM